MHKFITTNAKMFVIIGREDNPIYTLNFKANKGKESNDYQNQLAIHASLDELDELIWKKTGLFVLFELKKADTSPLCYTASLYTLPPPFFTIMLTELSSLQKKKVFGTNRQHS